MCRVAGLESFKEGPYNDSKMRAIMVHGFGIVVSKYLLLGELATPVATGPMCRLGHVPQILYSWISLTLLKDLINHKIRVLYYAVQSQRG